GVVERGLHVGGGLAHVLADLRLLLGLGGGRRGLLGGGCLGRVVARHGSGPLVTSSRSSCWRRSCAAPCANARCCACAGRGRGGCGGAASRGSRRSPSGGWMFCITWRRSTPSTG